jgi:3-methyl-2-oxobutanoate hydroxymethyltransferase
MALMKSADKKHTVQDIRAAKNGAEPFLALTAYTAPVAQLTNEVAELVLVGDSLGMVLYGMPSTLPVPLEIMIAHGRAVVPFCTKAVCVVDLPFGSYQASPAQAFETSAKILKETGCEAVKLEGGAEMAETVRFLHARGVPVLGHVGLKPQQVNVMGGYKVQGKDSASIAALLRDAKAIAEAGAFAMVLEGVVEHVATEITRAVNIPTIGIGASAACDGQILVTEDVLGLTPGAHARFVKAYAHFYQDAQAALRQLQQDVKTRRFPAEENLYTDKAGKAS